MIIITNYNLKLMISITIKCKGTNKQTACRPGGRRKLLESPAGRLAQTLRVAGKLARRRGGGREPLETPAGKPANAGRVYSFPSPAMERGGGVFIGVLTTAPEIQNSFTSCPNDLTRSRSYLILYDLIMFSRVW